MSGCVCAHERTRYLRTRPRGGSVEGDAALYLDFERGRMTLRCDARDGGEQATRTAWAAMRYCPLCGREIGAG